MANISNIKNGESGLSARNKINAAIAEANAVDDKQDAAALGSAAFNNTGDFVGAGAVGSQNVTTTTGTQTVVQALDQRGPVFDNVADMQAASGLTVGIKCRTLGYYAPGDGGGNDYEIVAAGAGSNYGFLFEQLTGSGLEAKLLGGGIMEDKTVYIPSDYATLQESLSALGRLNVLNGAEISHIIESGHKITHGVFLSGGDYSRHKISSADDTVFLSEDFTGIDVTSVLENVAIEGPSNKGLFIFRDCSYAPIINIKADMEGLLGGVGVYVYNTHAHILQGSGVINSGNRGLTVNSAQCRAIATHWDGAGRMAITAQQGALITAQASTANDVGWDDPGNSRAIYISRTSTINFQSGEARNSLGQFTVESRRSRFNGELGDFSGAAGGAILADRNSQVNIDGANISSAGGNGFVCTRGSQGNANEANAENCGGTGIAATMTSTINARRAIANGCSTGFSATQGAAVNASDGEANNCSGNAISVDAGGSVVFQGGSATGAGNFGAFVRQGSSLDADGANLSGASTRGITAFAGANANLRNANCRIGVDNNDDDIVVVSGSTVNANGAVGGSALPPNTVTSDGVIFR